MTRSQHNKLLTRSLTPPSYSVIENRRGDLVNQTLKVVWPERPDKGRHSVQGYLARRNKAREAREEEERQREIDMKIEAGWTVTTDDENAESKGLPIAPKIASKFIGIQCDSHLIDFLKPFEIVLYYSRPEYYNRISDVPISFPLMCAYMSSRGQIYCYRIRQVKYHGAVMWEVSTKKTGVPEQPRFHSLNDLLRYYDTFTVKWWKDGRLERFPMPVPWLETQP